MFHISDTDTASLHRHIGLRTMFPSGSFLALWILIFFTLVIVIAPGEAFAKKKSTKDKGDNSKYASLVLDADTGEILSQSNADKKLHPASLTKVMTLLMVFEALDQGRIKLYDKIPISKYAASMSPSKIGLPAGSTIRVKDAILALVTKSANDISAAIAEHLAGTEGNFARKMTARAQELGMTSTRFKNAHGLHHPDQISTARDMARLARFVILRYPEYYRYFSTKNFNYQGRSYRNHNRLMETYKGMDGMKTGYIAASGFNLIASVVRDDRRLIGVVFGGRSTQTRNDHMAEILNNGFAKLSDVRIARTDTQTQKSHTPAKPILDNSLPRLAAPPPIPQRKPQTQTQQIAALGTLALPSSALYPGTLKSRDTRPAAVEIMPLLPKDTAPTPNTRTATLNPVLEQNFEEVTGEGDYDQAIDKRINSGKNSISSLKSTNLEKQAPVQNNILTVPSTATKVIYRPPPAIKSSQPWSVQIGAFTSRAATDEAIQKTLRNLPAPYSSAQAIIAPLKTADGWLFRGRLTGFTKIEALSACNYIPECLPVAPAN